MMHVRTNPRPVVLGTLALVVLAIAAILFGGAREASAADRDESFIDHPSLVPLTPRRDMPVILNPTDPANARENLATLAIDLIDGFVVSGGSFQDAVTPDGQVIRQPHLLIWDDLTSALQCRGLTPDREVLAITAGPTPGTVIIAGRFNAITDPQGNTTTRRKIAKIDLSTCTVDQNWAVPAPNSKITELAAINGRLFIGGNFTALGGTPIDHVAEVAHATGALNTAFSFTIEGDTNRTMIVGMDVAPNGSRLGIVFKGTSIDGVDQRGTAIFNISNATQPSLTAHQLDQNSIPWRYHWLIQDGGFSPDFTSVAIANGTQVLEADQISLAKTTEAPGQFEWVKNMWDTTFAIDMSNNAVYAGGHFCSIEPGPGATDLMAPNGLDNCTGVAFGGTAWRSQLAAFSITDGTPLTWNPGSNAYKGVVALKVVSRGLLIGQDGSRINSFNVGTSSFLDFGQNVDDTRPPSIEGAAWSVTNGTLTVTGIAKDDIRAERALIGIQEADGRWLQANGTLSTLSHHFTVTPDADGDFTLATTIPSGRYVLTIDAQDFAGQSAPTQSLDVDIDGNEPANGTCVASSVNGQTELEWGSFNNEDDTYSVRTAAGWVATVPAGTREWTGPVDTYSIRSREAGQTIDLACTGAVAPPPPPPPVDPACRADPQGGATRLTWDAINGEDDSYQVRSADKWLATVAAGVRSVDVTAPSPVFVVSREQGVTQTLECTWTDDAPAAITINKPATQSSTYANIWVADRAIDGNTDGVFNNGQVSSTNREIEPWLQVELDAATELDQIQLWNRADCCQERLASAYVFISDASMSDRSVAQLLADPTVTAFAVSSNPTQVETIELGGVTGTFVKVQLPRTDFLTIAEIILFG